MIEPLYARFVRELHGIEVETPFPRIPYDEMLARFGTDKPDLRYGMELVDLADVFTRTGFNAFASVMATEGGAIKGLAAPGGSQLAEGARPARPGREGRGAAGLVWVVVEADGIRSPVEKHLSAEGRSRPRLRRGRGRPDLHRRRLDRSRTSPSTVSAGTSPTG